MKKFNHLMLGLTTFFLSIFYIQANAAMINVTFVNNSGYYVKILQNGSLMAGIKNGSSLVRSFSQGQKYNLGYAEYPCDRCTNLIAEHLQCATLMPLKATGKVNIPPSLVNCPVVQ